MGVAYIALLVIISYWANAWQLLSKDQKYWKQTFHSIAYDWTFSNFYSGFVLQDEPCYEPAETIAFN